MLLEPHRPWRHRALIPLALTEAVKTVYVAKWTDKRVTVYVPDGKGGVKKVAVAHKNLGKYAHKTVDPPPGQKPVGFVADPSKYTGPKDIISVSAPSAVPTSAPAPAKKAKFIPVFDWGEKSVWVWVKKSGGQPVLTEIPHKKIKGYAKRLGWVTQKVKLVGKIDPTSYSGPEDIYPLDWDPGDGSPGFIPTVTNSISTEFVPEYEDEKAVPAAEPEQVVIKPITDPSVPKLNIPAEFETLSKTDPNGFPQVKHKGSGLHYSVISSGSLAVWDKDVGKYLPIKKTSGGWDFDHDAPIISPKTLKKTQEVESGKFSGPPDDPKKGIKRDGEDPNGLPAYKITDPEPFPGSVPGSIVYLPSGEWAYLDGSTYYTLEWEDGEWWEGDAEYSASAVAKMKPTVLPKGFKLPGDGYKVKTATKDYVVVLTPDGESIKWDAKQHAWFLMDEPWKEWSPPVLGSKPQPVPGTDVPDGAPTPPPGFTVTSGPNKAGAWPLSTKDFHDASNWFLLPNGKLAKYDDYKGTYETYTYSAKGLVLDNAPGLTSVSVKMQQYYPEPLPVPDGYQLAGYDLNGLPQVNQGKGTKLVTLLPNGMTAVWSPSKEAYKTQTGSSLTLGQVLVGDFGSLSIPKTTVAKAPEEGAYATKFLDKLDPNGFPMVDEVDPDDPESPYTATDLTLMPDQTVARLSTAGYYLLYKWDTDEGYIQTHTSLPVQDVERLQASLGLTVQDFRYHKVVQVGDESSVEAGGPPGFELLTPTPEQKGLIPAKALATGKTYFLLPGNLSALYDESFVAIGLYPLYQVGPGGKLTHLNKSATIEMLRAMTQGYDPEPPDHTKYVQGSKAFDKHGYPHVVDVEGERLTLLPNGEVAKWDKPTKTYEIWAYDYGFEGYYPRHPEKAYTLKQVEKLKLKKLKNFKSVSPTKIPEPKVAPPSTAVTPEEQKGVPVPTGAKDLNGYAVYKYGDGQPFSKIPIDTGWGTWKSDVGAYAIRYYNQTTDTFNTQHKGFFIAYWYPGDTQSHAGLKKGVKGIPKWKFVPSAKKDPHGYPMVHLALNGKRHSTYVQLPTGDLGRWSTANKAYLIHTIDKNPIPPEAIPVYSTSEFFKPKIDVGGYKYPFEVKWKLPKEWKPKENDDLSAKVYGSWKYSKGTTTAELKPDGEIYVTSTTTIPGVPELYDPTIGFYISVWDPMVGYLETPFTPKKKVPPKPLGIDPKQVEKDAAAADKPTGKGASQLIADLAGKLPDIDALTYKGDGGHLGGAGQKSIFEDPTTGMKFIFKPALPKGGSKTEAFRAHAQEAFSALATRVREDHIPIKTVTYKGKLGTLQPMVELDAKQSDLKKAGGMAPEQLTPQQQEDVGTEHMLSWLMSQHDDHRGNLLKTKDGRIISVDKEQGWKYFDFDKLDVDFHPNSKYGEEEPFYNKFWRAFSTGKIDFDPMTLRKPLTKIEDMASEDYLKTLNGYAQASFPGDEVKQYRFRQKALKRKLRLRKDFEDFITKLFEKRTGSKGTFNFEEGWLSEGDKQTKKYKTITIEAKDLIPPPGQKSTPKTVEAQQKFGIDIRVYPYEFVDPTTKQKTADPTRLTLKIPTGGSKTKFLEFLDQLGLKPIPFPNGEDTLVGQAYFMAAVNRAEFEKASITKKVLITGAFGSTPAKPRYWPELPEPAKMKPTLEKDLKELDSKKLGREGHAMLSDGSGVEGQAAKAKRWKDKKGEFYFLTFKLRPKLWEKIKSSGNTTSASYKFHEADYDPKKDLFVEQPSSSSSDTGYEWQYEGVECFLATGKYTYRGQVYMKMRGVSSSQILSKAKAALNYATSGVGDDVFRDPTPEDREVMKMMRLLWALRPQTADKLPEEDRTIPKLRARLKKLGALSDLGKIEEQEVFKGYHSHVIPGRWKEMEGLLFVWNGIGSQEAALSIMRSGLMSIHERNLAGIARFGTSYSSDEGTGSGDGSICRVAVKKGSSHSFSGHHGAGKYQAILHPDVMDRLDPYMHSTDRFGNCDPNNGNYGSAWRNRKPVDKTVASLNKSYSSGNEISFRKGIHKSKIVRITCSSEGNRKSLITAARDEGFEEVNGIPIDDFVVVASSFGDAYSRYVKPLLGA